MEITARQYISNQKGVNSYTTIFKHFYGKNEKKVNKQGDIYTLINISSKRNSKIERISKFVWDSIVDGYLYSSHSSTNDSLKEALSQGVEKVKSLIRNDKELEAEGLDISFVVVVAKEEGIYIGTFGESDIYAYKKDSLVKISDILKEKRVNTVGVNLQKDDVLAVFSKTDIEVNEEIFDTVKNTNQFVEMLDRVGTSFQGSSSMIYFVKGNKEKQIVKKDRIKIPTLLDVKSKAESIIKPVARVEMIKESSEKKDNKGSLKNILPKKFESLNVYIKKVSEFLKPLTSKILHILKKVSVFLQSKWNIVKEEIISNLGKKRWYKKIAAKFSEINIHKRKPVGVRGMRIDDYKVKDQRGKRIKLVFMVVTILILLALGINFTIKMKHSREVSKLANEKFTQIEEYLKKGEENVVSDRTSAETYLYQAENLFPDIPSDLNEKDKEKFLDLEKKVLNLGDSLYRRVGVSEENGKLANFLDSRLAFGEGSKVVDMGTYKDASGNEYLVVADNGRKTVYRVSLYDKSVKAIPDNEGLVRSPEHVYVGTQGIYVYDSRGGILKASFDEEGWFSAFTSLSGLGVGDIKAEDISEMTVWTASDNVYFLSKDRGSLLKSTPAYGDRYGLTYSYFNHESMKVATDMVADLSIYVISPQDPQLVRFNYSYFESKYSEAPLGVLGFDGNWGSLTKAYTGETLDNALYLFDSQGKRFLKFEKPIEAGLDIRHPNEILLLNQYVYRDGKDSVLGDVKNFIVDSKESSIYILDSSVIWKLSM